MPTDIIMPQMGESIVEGTITKWLKKPGDKIQRDEPLFEISTDKVDAEIPAPASGVLQEIKVTEGTTVRVNTVVGTISRWRWRRQPKPRRAAEKKSAPAPARSQSRSRGLLRHPRPMQLPPAHVHEDDEQARSSPLVRKIAREHNVNLSQVEGTGLGGRITKQDIQAFIEQPGSAHRSRPPRLAAPAQTARRCCVAAPTALRRSGRPRSRVSPATSSP